MPKIKQQRLLEEHEVQQVDDKLLSLMKRLGIEALPPHETRLLPIERILVTGEALVNRSAKKLAKSISKVGILQPPSVVLLTGTSIDDPEATFEVLAGRRRVIAARLVGMPVVKCEVYASGTPQLKALLALIENEQRSTAWVKEVEDLRRLIDEGVGMTLDDLAEFGFDRVTLAERLKMALLPDLLFGQIATGKVSHDVAKKITRLSQTQQAKLVHLVLEGETITADLVTAILRMQINTALAPVQTALMHVWMPVPDQVEPPVTNGQHPSATAALIASEPGACTGTPTLAHVLAFLQAFEPQIGTGTEMSRLRTLTKALVQEMQVVLREQQQQHNQPTLQHEETERIHSHV